MEGQRRFLRLRPLGSAFPLSPCVSCFSNLNQILLLLPLDLFFCPLDEREQSNAARHPARNSGRCYFICLRTLEFISDHCVYALCQQQSQDEFARCTTGGMSFEDANPGRDNVSQTTPGTGTDAGALPSRHERVSLPIFLSLQLGQCH